MTKLEEAIQRRLKTYNGEWLDEDVLIDVTKEMATEFTNIVKKELMKDAVEGQLGKPQGWQSGGKNNPNFEVTALIPPKGFTYGETVKVIVIKK